MADNNNDLKSTMNISITTAIKTDKKSLMRFYKQQHYSAGLLGFDKIYVIKHEAVIIGAVIISALEKDNMQLFLHGLVVDEKFQHQGLASKLLEYARGIHSSQSIVCFAGNELSEFYQKNDFVLSDEKNYFPLYSLAIYNIKKPITLYWFLIIIINATDNIKRCFLLLQPYFLVNKQWSLVQHRPVPVLSRHKYL
jgi:GNAT superfamily N-acetyltransferase